MPLTTLNEWISTGSGVTHHVRYLIYCTISCYFFFTVQGNSSLEMDPVSVSQALGVIVLWYV